MSNGTEFVNHWMEAAIRGDADTLVAMTHPDSVHTNPDGTFRGQVGIRDLFQPLFDATSQREVQISRVVEDGDTVVVEFVNRGKHTSALVTPQGTIPPTGKTIEIAMIAIYDLRDGKLAGSRGIYDRLGLAAQLGLVPTPAQV